MLQEIEIKQENPFDVETIDEFLFYCCPQCDTKCKDGKDFIEHARKTHTQAKKVQLRLPRAKVISDLQLEEEDYAASEHFDDVSEEKDGVNMSENIADELPEPIDHFDEVLEDKEDIKPTVEELHDVLMKSEPTIKKKVRSAKAKKTTKPSKAPKKEITKPYVLQSDGKYHCTFCDYTNANKSTFTQHVSRKHTRYGQHKCEVCGHVCFNSSHLEDHMMSKHQDDKPFMCDKCDFKTITLQRLNLHMKKHEDRPKEVCYVCGKSFRSHKSLKDHIALHHSEDSQKGAVCELCGKTVKQGSMKAHLLKHSRNQVCTICEKALIGGYTLLINHLAKDHQVYCHEKDLFVCHICKQKCHTSNELNDHLGKNHAVRSNVNCEKCEHRFATKTLLSIHMIDCHGINPIKATEKWGKATKVIQTSNTKAFPCDQCDKLLGSYRTLYQHKKQVHDKSSHIKCDQCDFTTFEKYRLKKHVLATHEEKTKYPCDSCSYVTNTKSCLKKHVQMVHLKLKPYSCSECGKAFEANINLAKHMLTEHNIVYKYNQNQSDL